MMWLKSFRSRTQRLLLAALYILLAFCAGCASPRGVSANRPFTFGKDTFAYVNELEWEYKYDDQGRWEALDREPPPEYSLHCFPMARAAREFFYHARFDPAQPRLDASAYRKLVQQVVFRNSRRASSKKDRIIFPGFADLHEFSAAHPDILKDKCGGWFASYFQRGNWRVIFPYTRSQQARTADKLKQKLSRGELPIVHVATFPLLNHAIVLYAFEDEPDRTIFTAYDPNSLSRPLQIIYQKGQRSFEMPRTSYFPGGRIGAYEVYTGLCF